MRFSTLFATTTGFLSLLRSDPARVESSSCLRILAVLLLAMLAMVSVNPAAVAQEQKLLASDGRAWDEFGRSVSISGDYAIIGAWAADIDGAAYVFEQVAGTWIERQKLLPSDADGGFFDQFGYSVSISGDYAIVGAWFDDDNGMDSGSAYIFERVAGTWVEQQKLLASDGQADDAFGAEVVISGNYAIVGAIYDDDNGSSSGSAYVFERMAGTWVERQKLLASDGQAGDLFGAEVSISGDDAIVGALQDDDNGSASGSAYIFERVAGTWTQQQKLLASDGQAGDLFGAEVSISGDDAIIGAQRDDDNGINSGSAYIFERVAGTWTQQQKLLASDGQEGDYFGASALISGDDVIVGTIYDDDNGTDSGSAYVFERVAGTWVERPKFLASDGQAGDIFGFAVSISGDNFIVGALGDDDKGTNAGAAYAYDLPSFTLTLKKLIRTTSSTKKVKLKWNPATVNKGKLDFYVDELPDRSPLKRTANDGKLKLKLPTNQFPSDGPFAIQACEKKSTTICSNVIIADFSGVAPDLNEPEDDPEDDGYAAKDATALAFALEGNHPNPFNPVTTIGYVLPEEALVKLVVYDVLGRAVATLVDGRQEVGRHAASFDATRLPSGTYVYRLEALGQVETGRMLLLK